jgi:hypothetical protein
MQAVADDGYYVGMRIRFKRKDEIWHNATVINEGAEGRWDVR